MSRAASFSQHSDGTDQRPGGDLPQVEVDERAPISGTRGGRVLDSGIRDGWVAVRGATQDALAAFLSVPAMPTWQDQTVPLTTATGALRWELASEPASARTARRAAADACRRWRLHGLVDDAELVVDELVGNALRHTAGRGNVLLSITQCGGGLVIEVTDGDPAPPVPREVGPLAEAGRGLGLVAALSQACGYYRSGHGKTVWSLLADTSATAGADPRPRREAPSTVLLTDQQEPSGIPVAAGGAGGRRL